MSPHYRLSSFSSRKLPDASPLQHEVLPSLIVTPGVSGPHGPWPLHPGPGPLAPTACGRPIPVNPPLPPPRLCSLALELCAIWIRVTLWPPFPVLLGPAPARAKLEGPGQAGQCWGRSNASHSPSRPSSPGPAVSHAIFDGALGASLLSPPLIPAVAFFICLDALSASQLPGLSSLPNPVNFNTIA